MTTTAEAPVSSSGHLIMELMAGSDTVARTRAQAAHLAAVQTHKAAQAIAIDLGRVHPEARFISLMFDGTGTAQLLDLLGRDRRSLTLYGFISGDAVNEALPLLEFLDADAPLWTSDVCEERQSGERSVFLIRIQDLLATPAPQDAAWGTDPRTKALSAEEQDDLIEAAYHALGAIEDAAEAADDPHVRDRHEALKDRLDTLLAGTRASTPGWVRGEG